MRDLQNARGWCAVRLPVDASRSIAPGSDWWERVHRHGELVDALPGYTVPMVDILLDDLASEHRLNFNRLQLNVFRSAATAATRLVGLFDAHELRVLKTRLEKRFVSRPTATAVFRCYERESSGEGALDQDWVGFLLRQAARGLDQRSVLAIAVRD